MRNERGQALLETALILPIVLLLMAGIFEFGRAYQVVQVLTNAAREGSRVAILPYVGANTDAVIRAQGYLANGGVKGATVTVTPTLMNIGASTVAGTQVKISYPFSFMVLNPLAQLVVKGSLVGNAPLTLNVASEMRIEAQ